MAKKILRLFFLMLRYRVAAMLSLFFFLALALHGKVHLLSLNYFLALVALFFSFIAATTINDIADKDIDSVNHPNNKGRPLVTGEVQVRELLVVHFSAIGLAMIFALLISFNALFILVISIGINYIYSVKPFRLSYRTHFAPLVLSLAYVGTPYFLALEASGSGWGSKDSLFFLSLLFLFLGRIVLKDFRDRKGDALYGKPTFLLEYGKSATCAISVGSIFIGDILLLYVFKSNLFFFLLTLGIFFIAIFYVLYNLWKSEEGDAEQVLIGSGAKLGNGTLLLILGVLILGEYERTFEAQMVFVATTLFMFAVHFYYLRQSKQEMIKSYRG